MLNKQQKEYLLNDYLRNISHLFDKEYQKRVWIRREGPECQAFDDAVCDFFDIGEPILGDYRDFGITDYQYNLIIKLRDNFETFSNAYDFPEEFIDTPEWAKIMDMAKEVITALKKESSNVQLKPTPGGEAKLFNTAFST